MPREKFYLTTEGLEKLKAELEHLYTVRRQEVAERIQRAKELTDTVDNAEYDDAKNEQAFVEGRILTLERMIKNAEIISAEVSPSERVKLGSWVTVKTQDGEEEHYIIVGSAEANPSEGRISNESPVGKALLGKGIGEEVEVEVPAGVLKLIVKAIG
jgi:transcription elongation factor GreA